MITHDMTIDNWKSKVAAKLKELDNKARELWPIADLRPYKVSYKLKGNAAGQAQCCINLSTNQIKSYTFKFNKYFAVNWPNKLEDTIIHEYAHYVCDCIYREKNMGHNEVWKNTAIKLGGSDETHHKWPAEKICRFYFLHMFYSLAKYSIWR